MPLKLHIDIEARNSLRNAYHYIKQHSPQNAEKVRLEILLSIKKILNNPYCHPPDKYRLNNDSSYRAYEIYKYRISYHVTENEIRILRIRHTKMKPLNY